jgi:hypothetical protein
MHVGDEASLEKFWHRLEAKEHVAIPASSSHDVLVR